VSGTPRSHPLPDDAFTHTAVSNLAEARPICPPARAVGALIRSRSSTHHVESQNLNIPTHTVHALTNVFNTRLENHPQHVALKFVYDNFWKSI
jgi:hypothetical protein